MSESVKSPRNRPLRRRGASPVNTGGTQQQTREKLLNVFWSYTDQQADALEADRLKRIQEGFKPVLVNALCITFNIRRDDLASLLDTSSSTLDRRQRHKQRLEPTISEKLDRILAVTHLADDVFEDREEAIAWMNRPNAALGEQPPLMLCGTELGAKQVRRILHALEWGGVA